MKMIKRMLSGVLAAAMITASASFISAAKVTFTDIGSSYWAKNYISYLVEKDVLNGYKQNDGTYMFKPEDTVTRAEFIKMLDETFGLVDTANINGKYKDVNQGDWFYEYFAKAVAQGYIHNYGENATPNGALSREEATSLLVRYLDLPDNEKASASTFTDYSSISSYYNQDVLKAVSASLINGYKENNGTYTFRPKSTLTRAEALTILYRAAGAIFTADRNGADSAAFESNAVIKKGGIALTSQNLNGRVIISEGADSGTVHFKQSKINDTLYIRGGANVTLESTKVKNLVVDSPDIVNITVTTNSEIENLIINQRCGLMIGSGTTVKNLTAAVGADHITITGTGAIEKAVINANGFTSTMVPHEFEIAGGCTATFKSKEYQGASNAQAAFLNTPFMTKENNVHCINAIALEEGTIRYYFTASPYCPGISDFDEYYSTAAYKSSFDVEKNTSEVGYTYNTGYVKSFDYIVLQLVSNGRYFPPVIIPNKDAVGTGFTVDPQLENGKTINYTASGEGTVFYMYSLNGSHMNTNDFLLAYNEQSNSLKGELKQRSGSVDVNATYANVNNYMAFMFQSSDGLYHKPVVISLGDNGFSKDPVVVTHGTIEFTSAVSGTLYYYYSETADLPSPEKFSTWWRAAADSSDMSVDKGKVARLTYSTKDKYPYMILCLRTDASDYKLPVAVRIDYDTGFEYLPEIISGTTIRFEPDEDGVVKYYYTKTQTAPTPSAFKTNYDKASGKLKGSVEALDGVFDTIAYDPATAVEYRYMVFMLEDDFGSSYQPVVVSLTGTANTGFSTAPYVYGDKLYFKTADDCEVWYFYARSNEQIPMSEFYSIWSRLTYSYTVSASEGSTKSITLDKALLADYPYIVLATSADLNAEISTYPVVVNAAEESKNTSGSALKVTNVTATSVVLTAFAEGTIYYYETNVYGTPAKGDFDTEYMDTDYIYRGNTYVKAATDGVQIKVSGKYKYLVLRLESEDANGTKLLYDAMFVNTADGSVSGDSTGNGNTTGSTFYGYGFSIEDIDPTRKTVIVSSDHTGTIDLILATEDGKTVFSEKSFAVTKGGEIEIDYPAGSGFLGGLKLYLFLQLTDEDGRTYERYAIEMAQ